MAALLTQAVLFVFLWDFGSSISYQETRKNHGISRLRRFKEPCVDGRLCAASDNDLNRTPGLKRPSKPCRSNAECIDGEYCHAFQRLCLRPPEPATVAPVKSSVKKCSRDLDCKRTEYCHDFWKICLPSQKVYIPPPTKQPSRYCRTSDNCNIDEQCHKSFRVCYPRPGMSTVRRDTGNSRRCDKTSECGANFYCHKHFRICIENAKSPTTKPPTKSSKAKTCGPSIPCPPNMLCHNLWNICYTPAPVVTIPLNNKTQQCRIDSDCKAGEVCHTMAARTGQVVARQRRNIQRICISGKNPQSPKSDGDKTCKTSADCGPNKCCLVNLSICMAYNLPGEMCLLGQGDLVCPCASGSYCKTRGKWASPRRIINKMKLPRTAANQFLKQSHKKKQKVGKCTPSSF